MKSLLKILMRWNYVKSPNHSDRIQRWQQLVVCSAQCLFQSPLCAPKSFIWAPCKSCLVILFDFVCGKQCIIVYSPCCGRFRGYVPPPWIWILIFHLLSVYHLFLFILPLTWIILVCRPWPISVPPWATNTVLESNSLKAKRWHLFYCLWVEDTPVDQGMISNNLV